MSAAIVHALIGIAGDLGLGGDAYADRDHAAVGPVALGAVTLAAILLLSSILRATVGRTAADPLLLLARRLSTIDPVLPCLAVMLGCSTVLAGMEYAEQVLAFGHVVGLADALGGSVAFGSLAIALTAPLIAICGLRFARTLVEAAVAAGAIVVAWFRKAMRTRDFSAGVVAFAPRRRTAWRLLAHSAALRAPPPSG